MPSRGRRGHGLGVPQAPEELGNPSCSLPVNRDGNQFVLEPDGPMAAGIFGDCYRSGRRGWMIHPRPSPQTGATVTKVTGHPARWVPLGEPTANPCYKTTPHSHLIDLDLLSSKPTGRWDEALL